MRRQITKLTAFVLLVMMLGMNIPMASAQVRPVYDMGAGGLGLKLRRLPTIASAVHTGAHPDDEDSALIATLARGYNARVAYLALNRGEGGQNVIGPELFESLGTIRSEELLQARRLDGGSQMFTSVMDYGFSKKREEAARIWGEKEVLADMVRAIRFFRPLVIIARFTGTPADGHGQHQLSGYLTPQAYKAAADPNMFPEQIAEGLRPWKPLKLYVSQSMQANSANPPSLLVQTGTLDPLIGRSFNEIASEGRSQHKTQEMGTLELRGKTQSGVRLLDAETKVENEKSVFDGIDTTIRGIAKISGDESAGFKAKLDELQIVAEAGASFNPYQPQRLIPTLAQGMRLADEAAAATSSAEAKWFLSQKKKDFADALQAAAGIVVDAVSDSETVVNGDSVGVAVRMFAPERSGVQFVSAEIKAGAGWKSEAAAEPKQETANPFRSRNEVANSVNYFKLTSPSSAIPTQPYWLVKPRKNFTFDWSAAGDAKNMPFQSDEAYAEVKVRVGGEDLVIHKNVEYRYADDIRGELRRPLSVVPLVTNTLDSNLIISPNSVRAATERVVMSITNNAPRETKGSATLDLPKGWSASPASIPFTLKAKGDKTAVSFTVSIPGDTPNGSYKITAKSVVDGKDYAQTVQEIAYPHIQTHRRYSASTVDVKVLNLGVSNVRVGYIMGSGDRVPEAVKLLGLSLTMLSEKDLTTGDLGRFDVILVGIRASQVRPDFVANNGRLLDYVRNGGTMIVQYQQSEFIQNNMLPFPARMDSVVNGTQRLSNLRAVEEEAPVKILVPNHPVFNYPNKITSADFDNWIQERHLYSLSQLDKAWTPLLESHDAGEAEINGGLVWAKLGRGNYIYNSYSFFRQLPTGNPGAFRLFANLLSLPNAGGK